LGAQGEALAAQVQQVADQLVGVIESCPEERWRATTAAEGWSVGVAAHHAAGSLGPTTQFVVAVAKGMPLPQISPEIIDHGNAQHAREFAGCTKSETIELARTQGASAAEMLRGLTDEDLARTATLSFTGDRTVSAGEIAQFLVLGHPKGHMESIKATV